jgi:hypothetical protein
VTARKIGITPTHRRIHRYDVVEDITSPLNPLDDAVSWLSGLKSHAYTSDVLAQIHGMRGPENQASASAIAALAAVAVQFLEQASAGPPELSYLPNYYAMLNLAKATAIARGMLPRLEQERRHGVSWPGIQAPSQDLLRDEICLWPGGAVPLMYGALTGQSLLPSTTSPLQVRLADIYPYIVTVGYELTKAYSAPTRLASIIVYQELTEGALPRVYAQFAPDEVPTSEDLAMYPFLQGFLKEGDVAFAFPPPKEAAVSVPSDIPARCRRYLLYDLPGVVTTPVRVGGFQGAQRGAFVNTYTPISNLPFLLPEEFPIILAFFHLSSIVRYAPLHLRSLLDSRAAAMLHALARHGTYRFLILFWSFFNQRTYVLHP